MKEEGRPWESPWRESEAVTSRGPRCGGCGDRPRKAGTSGRGQQSLQVGAAAVSDIENSTADSGRSAGGPGRWNSLLRLQSRGLLHLNSQHHVSQSSEFQATKTAPLQQLH